GNCFCPAAAFARRLLPCARLEPSENTRPRNPAIDTHVPRAQSATSRCRSPDKWAAAATHASTPIFRRVCRQRRPRSDQTTRTHARGQTRVSQRHTCFCDGGRRQADLRAPPAPRSFSRWSRQTPEPCTESVLT